MVEQLERDGRETGAVELRTLSEATFPTVPATPHRLINLVIGLAVGAVAASVVLLATALRHFLLRRRTRSQWAYVELDGEPKLALASAERALKGIPQGTPDFLRAQDIAMVSRTEVEKNRKGRGR